MNKKLKVFICAELFFGVIGNYILMILHFLLTALKMGNSLILTSDVLNPFVYLGNCNIDDFFIKFFAFGNILIFIFPVYFSFVYEPKGKIMKTV